MFSILFLFKLSSNCCLVQHLLDLPLTTCCLVQDLSDLQCVYIAWIQLRIVHVYYHIMLHLGGYFTSNESTKILRQTILELCIELKCESVSLVDAMSPPDFILHSPIGRADGQVSIICNLGI